jgi:hypothetical protein
VNSQRKPYTFSLLQLLTGGLLVLFAGLSVFALLQENDWESTDSLIKQLHLLSADTAVSLLVAVMGVGLTVQGMAQNATPYLVYESLRTKESLLGLQRSSKGYWRVVLRNAGTGLAICESLTIHLNSKGMSIQDFYAGLESLNIRAERDILLLNLSKGYALKSEAEIVLLETAYSTLPKIKEVQLTLDFRDGFGRKYRKEILFGVKKLNFGQVGKTYFFLTFF